MPKKRITRTKYIKVPSIAEERRIRKEQVTPFIKKLQLEKWATKIPERARKMKGSPQELEAKFVVNASRFIINKLNLPSSKRKQARPLAERAALYSHIQGLIEHENALRAGFIINVFKKLIREEKIPYIKELFEKALKNIEAAMKEHGATLNDEIQLLKSNAEMFRAVSDKYSAGLRKLLGPVDLMKFRSALSRAGGIIYTELQKPK